MTEMADILHAMVKQMKDDDLARFSPLSLGELVARLDSLPRDAVVEGVLADVHSYRGYYSDLAIEPGARATVGELADVLRGAIGAIFEGYKGGDFMMTRTTTVWVSAYGECSSDVVTGIETPRPGFYRLATCNEYGKEEVAAASHNRTIRDIADPLHVDADTAPYALEAAGHNAGIDALVDAVEGLELVLVPRALVLALASDLRALEAELSAYYAPGAPLTYATKFRQEDWPAARELVVLAAELEVSS